MAPEDEPPSTTSAAFSDRSQNAAVTAVCRPTYEISDDEDGSIDIPKDEILPGIHIYKASSDDDTPTSELMLREVVESTKYWENCGEALEGTFRPNGMFSAHKQDGESPSFILPSPITKTTSMPACYLLLIFQTPKGLFQTGFQQFKSETKSHAGQGEQGCNQPVFQGLQKQASGRQKMV